VNSPFDKVTISIMTDEELKQAWQELSQKKHESEWPFHIDVRPQDYLLSLSPDERIARLEYEINIRDLLSLADTTTLHQVLKLLHRSAQQNPFWNDGTAQWFWVGDARADGTG
jgi:hypothetical protein